MKIVGLVILLFTIPCNAQFVHTTLYATHCATSETLDSLKDFQKCNQPIPVAFSPNKITIWTEIIQEYTIGTLLWKSSTDSTTWLYYEARDEEDTDVIIGFKGYLDNKKAIKQLFVGYINYKWVYILNDETDILDE